MKGINKGQQLDYTTHPVEQRNVLPRVKIPSALYIALNKLQHHLVSTVSQNCDNYIKCIESLSNVQSIGHDDYFIVFKICLFLEQYQLDLDMTRYHLKSHKIQKVISGYYFIINVPSMDGEKSVVRDDIVILHEVITKKKFRGRVVNVEENNVTVELQYPLAKEFITDLTIKYDIYFYGNHWPLRCCHLALSLASKFNFLETLYPRQTINNTNIKCDINWINTEISKNEQQKQAVIKILQMTARPAPYIIFGPPGTGKTATLVEAICQIVEQNSRNYILVCTSSNAAADEITLRLMRYLPAEIIYRMYAPSKRWESIKKEIRKCANFIDSKSNATDNKAIFLPKEILMMRKIIISTLITSVRLFNVKFRENHFSHIIIDEASQAMEPEMLIPLILTKNPNKGDITNFQPQIVIAGDHYQLGPIIHSRYAQNILGKSMLERLMNDFDLYKKKDNKYDPNYVTKLVKNYRSHKCILHVPNEQFYENDLEYCGLPHTQIALNWQNLPSKKFPIIFQEVLGIEKRTAALSVYNTTEILVVMEYVKMLMNAQFGTYKIKAKDIGIITPFKEQKMLIMQQLAAKNWDQISVGTVDMFQGQERTVIIMSTARSQIFEHDNKKHIGLLSNPKRFNVSITRAKALLIIIGNPEIICTDKYWRILWEYCKKHGGYVPFDRCPLQPKIIADLKKCYETKSDIDASETIQAVYNKVSVNFASHQTDSMHRIQEKLKNFIHAIICYFDESQ